eukprot:CFRG3927T1
MVFSSNSEQLAAQFRVFSTLAAHPSAVIQSQQRDEPDLTINAKYEILQQTFNTNPRLFLERWGQYLTSADFAAFEEVSKIDAQVRELVFKIKRDCNVHERVIRNRRYQHVQKLVREGEYFNDIAMKARAPELFDQYVGRYMNESDRNQHMKQQESEYPRGGGFASFLMQEIDRCDDDRERRDFPKSSSNDDEEIQVVEFDSDDEDALPAVASETIPSNKPAATRNTQQSRSDTEETIDPNVGYTVDTSLFRDSRTMAMTGRAVSGLSREEKDELRAEFSRIMQERFIGGLDSMFDYHDIDNDDSLDYESKEYEQDLVDSYFDSD